MCTLYKKNFSHVHLNIIHFHIFILQKNRASQLRATELVLSIEGILEFTVTDTSFEPSSCGSPLSFDSPNLSGAATAGYMSPTLFDSPTPSPTLTPPPPASNDRTEALHTVTFKCIRATRAQSYQETLLKARDLMDQKEVVGSTEA